MAAVARLLPHALHSASAAPPAPAHQRLVIVADEPISAEERRLLFPKLAFAVFVRDAGAGPAPQRSRQRLGLHEVCWNPQQRGGFSSDEANLIRRAGATVVFLKPHAQCSGRMFRDLRRCGVRCAIFDECGRWRSASIERAILGKVRSDQPLAEQNGAAVPVLHRIGAVLDRSILRTVRAVAMDGATDLRRGMDEQFIARFSRNLAAIPRPQTPRRQVQRIMHFVSSLDSGGAERQVVHLAAAQRERGLEAAVRTQVALTGERAHFLPRLSERGVEARQAGAIDAASIESLAQSVRETPGLPEALRRVSPSIRSGVLDIFGEVMLQQPDVLHCWLDEPNVLGGAAGLLAGVPRIVLSTRNVNPSRFPHLHRLWMRPWYCFLARHPNVVFAGNSNAGIADYADWLGLDAARFILLRNAVPPEAFTAPSPHEIDALRREAGVGEGQPLIAGVMRLSIEKRPDLFVEAIRRIRLAHPQCRAVLAGVGPLGAEVRRQIVSLRLDEAISLLGQRRDVNVILAAADVVLLTSDHEGTPNSLIEALALGRGVVATDAGGVAEVIDHERTGLLADRGDVAALAASVNRLLKDPAQRAQFGNAGRAMVRERFALDAVVDRTFAAYFA